MLRRALERRNHHVLVAANAESALALVQHTEEPIGLVISEKQLSGISGIALAGQLRRHDPNLPVLLVGTGFADMPGEYPELDKPFTLEKLDQRIKDAIAAAPGERPTLSARSGVTAVASSPI